MAQFEKLSFQELARFAQLPQDEYARQICAQRKVEESSVLACVYTTTSWPWARPSTIFRLDMHGRPIGEPQPSQLGARLRLGGGRRRHENRSCVLVETKVCVFELV